MNAGRPAKLKVTAKYFLCQLIVIGASEKKCPGLTWEIKLCGNKTALGGGGEQLAEDHNTDSHLARRAPGGGGNDEVFFPAAPLPGGAYNWRGGPNGAPRRCSAVPRTGGEFQGKGGAWRALRV